MTKLKMNKKGYNRFQTEIIFKLVVEFEFATNSLKNPMKILKINE